MRSNKPPLQLPLAQPLRVAALRQPSADEDEIETPRRVTNERTLATMFLFDNFSSAITSLLSLDHYSEQLTSGGQGSWMIDPKVREEHTSVVKLVRRLCTSKAIEAAMREARAELNLQSQNNPPLPTRMEGSFASGSYAEHGTLRRRDASVNAFLGSPLLQFLQLIARACEMTNAICSTSYIIKPYPKFDIFLRGVPTIADVQKLLLRVARFYDTYFAPWESERTYDSILTTLSRPQLKELKDLCYEAERFWQQGPEEGKDVEYLVHRLGGKGQKSKDLKKDILNGKFFFESLRRQFSQYYRLQQLLDGAEEDFRTAITDFICKGHRLVLVKESLSSSEHNTKPAVRDRVCVVQSIAQANHQHQAALGRRALRRLGWTNDYFQCRLKTLLHEDRGEIV